MNQAWGRKLLTPLMAGVAGAAIALLLAGPARELDPTPAAAAGSLGSEGTMLLSRDSHFVTTSERGDEVFLWYFERAGEASRSRVLFVERTTAAAGPYLR